MVENIERTVVSQKRSRRKCLYFISEKERIKLSVGKKNTCRERKHILLS